MPTKDYYEILNLPPNANRSQIRSSYYKLAKLTHPDKKPSSSSSSSSNTSFHILQEAYETLIDEEKRKKNLYNGKKVSIEIERQLSCEKCNGHGYNRDARPKICQRCGGQGFHFRVVSSHGGLASETTICSSCDGLGAKIGSSNHCSNCHRSGTRSEKVKVEFQIMKGMLPGHLIRLPDRGDAEATPKSSDLLLPISITLSEALLGFNRLVFYHLDGKPIRLNLPSPHQPGHTIIKPNQIKKVKGFGLPPNGNLFIKFLIDWPTKDWIDQQDLDVLSKALPDKKIDLGSNLPNSEQVYLSFED
ncbi:hypothetical protein DFH28DRAFT_1168540 [Melampsora americana]|nr:hypothetical protein DFH28DRAFT_1168540 [Melampsora americana]